MYCGDETGSFVGVIGTHTSQFGYGGQDAPAAVIPSYVADDGTLPSSCHHARWAERGIRRPLRGPDAPPSKELTTTDPDAFLPQGDTIVDWDAYEQLWTGAMDQLRVKDTHKHTTGAAARPNAAASTTLRPAAAEASRVTHPLLVVTPGRTHAVGSTAAERRAARLRHVEICMESLQCGALFLAPAPMLMAFCHGRPTALVVDVNSDGTIVTPVVDGLLLRNAQRRSGRGEDWMGNVMERALREQGMQVQPRYAVRAGKKNMKVDKSSIFHAWAMRDVMYELRTTLQDKTWWLQSGHTHTVPFTNSNTAMDTDPPTNDEEEERPSYTLPDGTCIDLTTPVGRDLTRASELLCTSEALPFPASSNGTAEEEETTPPPHHHHQEHPTLSNLPLAPLIHASLSAVADADVRQQLRQATVVPHPSYAARIPSGKVLTSKHVVEQSCAAWIGGSILTSLGSFQQLWLSQTEYEEYGAALAVQRFPE